MKDQLGVDVKEWNGKGQAEGKTNHISEKILDIRKQIVKFASVLFVLFCNLIMCNKVTLFLHTQRHMFRIIVLIKKSYVLVYIALLMYRLNKLHSWHINSHETIILVFFDFSRHSICLNNYINMHGNNKSCKIWEHLGWKRAKQYIRCLRVFVYVPVCVIILI